jgi:hypothetical protein
MFKKYLFIPAILSIFCSSVYSANIGKSDWIIFEQSRDANTSGAVLASLDSGSLFSVFYNPALIGGYTQREVSFASKFGFADDKLNGIVYGEPFKNSMLLIGYYYYDAGSIELNFIENGVLNTQTVSLEKDQMGIVAYGREISKSLYIGGAFKAATSQIADMGTASAYVFDLGVAIRPIDNFTVSISGQNYGTSTVFANETSPLPNSGDITCSYLYKDNRLYVLPSVGLLYNFVDENPLTEMVLEVGMSNIFLDFGYSFDLQTGTILFGVSTMLKGMKLSYAYTTDNNLNVTNTFTVGYKFGGAKAKPAKTQNILRN